MNHSPDPNELFLRWLAVKILMRAIYDASVQQQAARREYKSRQTANRAARRVREADRALAWLNSEGRELAQALGLRPQRLSREHLQHYVAHIRGGDE